MTTKSPVRHDLVVCVGGPRDRWWFDPTSWEASRRAAEAMGRGRWESVLGYTVSTTVRAHPNERDTGTEWWWRPGDLPADLLLDPVSQPATDMVVVRPPCVGCGRLVDLLRPSGTCAHCPPRAA